MSQILTIACVQVLGHSFYHIYFIFSAIIGEYDVLPPYLFCRPGADFTKGLKPDFGLKFKTLVLNSGKKVLSQWA